MFQTAPAVPDSFRTDLEANVERAEYEAWLDDLVAQAPPIGPQTARMLSTFFAPYLDPAPTPETEMDLPHAA